MSTEYYLDKDKTISIDEQSSKLQLSMTDGSMASPWVYSDDLEPAEMVAILINGLRVCSYSMSDDEFKKSVKDSLESLSCTIFLEVS